MPEHAPNPSPPEEDPALNPEQSNQPEQGNLSGWVVAFPRANPDTLLELDNRENVEASSTLRSLLEEISSHQRNRVGQSHTANQLLTLAIDDPSVYLEFDQLKGVIVRSTSPFPEGVLRSRSYSEVLDRLVARGWITIEQRGVFETQILEDSQRGYTNLDCAARMLACAETLESCLQVAQDDSLNVELPNEIQADIEFFDAETLRRLYAVMTIIDSATSARHNLSLAVVKKWIPSDELDWVSQLEPLARGRESAELALESSQLHELEPDEIKSHGQATMVLADSLKAGTQEARETLGSRRTMLRGALENLNKLLGPGFGPPIDRGTRKKLLNTVRVVRNIRRLLEDFKRA